MTFLDDLDAYIEESRPDWANAGAAVAVVRGSEVIYARGFGPRQVGQDAQIDADTLFQVGSTTKAFAAATLGLLVDEGRLGWDDAIIDHLPGFQLHDPWVTRQVTIRDALAHRSGIANSYYPFFGLTTSDEAVRQLRYVRPQGAFRDSFIYSNLMYAAAGKVVEAVTGATWQEFVRQRILQPLDMNRSGVGPYEFWDAPLVTPTFFGSAPAGRPGLADARDANVAMPHGWTAAGEAVVLPWQSYDAAAPAGSIVSSAADMAKWVIPHLNQGRADGGRLLLSADTVQQLHAQQNLRGRPPQFPGDETYAGYALGWLRGRYKGRTHLCHGGGIVGFPAYVALLPERDIGVVVLCNGANPLFHKAISLWVFDYLLGEPRRNWSQDLSSHAAAQRREAEEKEVVLSASRAPSAPASLPLDQYAGVYEEQNGASGRVEVMLASGELSLTFPGEGAYRAPLEPWRNDMFRLRTNTGVAEVLGPQFASFTLNPAGAVRSMSAFDVTFHRLH